MISFTWRGFRKRGRIHRDGWGIDWYLSNGLVGTIKEPCPASDSPIARLMTRGVKSKIIISHVRKRSCGAVSYVNTHPFIRRFRDRDWVFAHNGTVAINIPDEEFRRYHPVGETDSERAFCYILEEFSQLQNEDLETMVTKLWSLAEEIGGYGASKFNFLLSDGKYLFAYMNKRKTLHYLLRHPPHRGLVKLVDEDFEVGLEELKAPDECIAIIATKPLTNEEWVPMKPGNLYVFHNGDLLLIVENGEPKLVLDKLEHDVLKTIRTAPHSVKIEEIADNLGLPIDEVTMIVQKLKNKGIIKQHSRDVVPPDHPIARYFTKPELRPVIDKTLSP